MEFVIIVIILLALYAAVKIISFILDVVTGSAVFFLRQGEKYKKRERKKERRQRSARRALGEKYKKREQEKSQ